MDKPLALTEALTLISNYIAGRYDQDTLAVIAASLVQVGDTLANIAAIRALEKQ